MTCNDPHGYFTLARRATYFALLLVLALAGYVTLALLGS